MDVGQLNIDYPYSSVQFWQNLAVYSTCEGTDEMLELSRQIQESGNYFWQGVSFPDSNNLTVAGGLTVNGTIQIPAGSYVTAITYYGLTAAGVNVKIFDKGTKASIFYGDYSLDRPVMSNMQQQYGVGTSFPPSDPGSNSDNPFGPAFLISPFVITPPGALGWEIVNRGNDPIIIQVMLSCAIPLMNHTIGTTIVGRS